MFQQADIFPFLGSSFDFFSNVAKRDDGLNGASQ
jgi:hypothetical protein